MAIKLTENNRLALLLAGFAFIGVTLVSIVNEVTRDQIKANQQAALRASLGKVLTQVEYNNALLDSVKMIPAEREVKDRLGNHEAFSVYLAMQDQRVNAIALPITAPDGYSGAIRLLIGVNRQLEVTGVSVLHHRETPGLGDKIEARHTDWLTAFTGKSLSKPSAQGWKVKRDGGQFDQFTGATITPRAVVKAVHKALQYIEYHKPEFFPEEVGKQDAN